MHSCNKPEQSLGPFFGGVRINKGGMLHMSEEVFVGIDIAQDQLDVHVLPEDTHVRFTNDV